MELKANDDLARTLETQGYAIVRGVFNEEELARLRTTLTEHFSKAGKRHNLGLTQPNAAIEVPALSWLYTHPRVLDLFRRALDTDDIVFTGHSDVHNSMLSGWHKDSGEHRGGYFKGDYFAAADCRVYKMAIYLEDHFGTGKGLTVRKASHHNADRTFGEPVVLDTRAGDVILFDVRLTHVGQRPDPIERIMFILNRRLLPSPDKADLQVFSVPRKFYTRLKGEKDRLSIFFTFGFPNHFTDEFSQSNMARQIEQTGNNTSELPHALQEGLRKANVRSYCGFA